MKFLKISILSLGGLIVGLILAEVIARFFLPYPMQQIALLRMRAPDLQMDAGTDLKNPNYNPFLQRRPFSDWICDGKNPEKMNNDGFRDRDFQVSKIPGKIRLAAIGDSFTEGWMSPRDSAFPRVLEGIFSSRVEVLNFGIANRSPLRYLALYDQVIRKYFPDVVLVCLYSNDVAEDEALRTYVTLDARGVPAHFDYERYFQHTPRMPQTKWERRRDKWQWTLCQYSRIYPYAAVSLTVDPEFRKRILEPPASDSFETRWAYTAGYLQTLNTLVKNDGGRFLLTYVPDLNDFSTKDPLAAHAEEFAKKHKIPFFDANAFLGLSSPSKLYIPGDGHFSDEGHQAYASFLNAWLQANVKELGQAEGESAAEAP
jgi:lysophospholipase L1-like esterase